jgi:hypothetical protein
MTGTPSPDPTGTTPTGTPDAHPAVEVDVARTGGIAGMTRRWSAQPPEAEASQWISLIDSCPWDDVPPSAEAHAADAGADPDDTRDHGAGRQSPVAANPMPDGFMWWIRATRSETDAREAELPDRDVVGAWRELVDAVRDWSPAGSGSASGSPGR